MEEGDINEAPGDESGRGRGAREDAVERCATRLAEMVVAHHAQFDWDEANDVWEEFTKGIWGLLVHLLQADGFGADAEDLAQQTLILAHGRLPTMRAANGARSFKAWFWSIQRNVVREELRKRQSKSGDCEDECGLTEGEDGEAGVEPSVPLKAAKSRSAREPKVEATEPAARVPVFRRLRAMGKPCYELLLYRHVLEFSEAEVAEVMESSTPTVTTQLSRCRKTARAKFPDLFATFQ